MLPSGDIPPAGDGRQVRLGHLARIDRGALIVLGVAVVARALTLVQATRAPFWASPIVDETAYLQLAQKLVDGAAPPFLAWYQAPGYAYFLAAVLACGGGVLSAKLIQLALGVVNSLLVWRLGRRWFGAREGVVAGLLWAIYPIALFHEVLLLKPTLAVLLSLLALTAIPGPASAAAAHGAGAERAPAAPGRTATLRWAGCGLCLGLAAIVQGEIAGVAVLLLIVAGWRAWRAAQASRESRATRPQASRALAPVVAALAAFVLVLAVPTAQNLGRGGGPVVVAYGGGVNFWIGNHAGADGGYLPLRPERGDAELEESDAVQIASAALGRTARPAEVSRFWWRQGLRWWADRPLAALALTLKKVALLWGPQEQSDVLDTGLLGRWIWTLRDPLVRPRLLLPLALVGLWLSWWRPSRRRPESSRPAQASPRPEPSPDLWAARAFLIGSTLMLAPFFVFERFRLPMTAAALPLAAHAAVRLWDAARARRFAWAGAGAGAAVVLAVIVALPQVRRDATVLRVNVGDTLLQAGRYEEALREFEAVRAATPSAWRVEINIAWAQAMAHHPDSALATLASVIPKLRAEERATGRTPVEELVSCYALDGDLMLAAGRSREAAESYRAGLALQPGHPVLTQKLRETDGAGLGAPPPVLAKLP